MVDFMNVNNCLCLAALADALEHHCLCNSLKAGNVSARDEVVAEVVLLAGIHCLLEDVDHDAFELLEYFILGEDGCQRLQVPLRGR